MPVMTKTPKGDDIVILSRKEYDDLLSRREDAADAAKLRASRARRAAGEETLSSDDVKALLAAKSPLAFWRARRGLTQAALAKDAGVAQGFVSEIEAGKKTGDVKTLQRIAVALKVSLNDLAPGLPAAPRGSSRA